jgi:hypothetical protein
MFGLLWTASFSTQDLKSNSETGTTGSIAHEELGSAHPPDVVGPSMRPLAMRASSKLRHAPTTIANQTALGAVQTIIFQKNRTKIAH